MEWNLIAKAKGRRQCKSTRFRRLAQQPRARLNSTSTATRVARGGSRNDAGGNGEGTRPAPACALVDPVVVVESRGLAGPGRGVSSVDSNRTRRAAGAGAQRACR